jgi:hypothetical protein
MRKETSKLAISILTISILILAGGVVLGQTSTPTPYATTTSIPNQTANVTETSIPNQAANVTETSTPNQTANVTETSTPNGSQNVIVNVNQNVTISTPITNEEKAKATNIAINLTVNIGIVNPTIVDVQRDRDNEKNLRVRVKDHDTNEIIVVIVNPQQPQEQAQINVPPPVFTEVENNFSGSHVSFQFNQSTITNFTVNGVVIFQTINLGFTSTNFKAIGTEFRIFNDKDMVIIHDNDNGIITEKSSEHIKQHFEASPDIKVTGNDKRVDLSEKIKASLVGSSNVVSTVSGNSIDVDINQGESTFVSSTTTDLLESRIIDGIAQQQVGSVVNIESESVHDITTFDVDTSVDQVATNTVSLSVNSALPQGKVIALKVNKDVLKDLNLKVLVDNGEIPTAIDFDDLFKVDKLKFLLVVGQEVEILVAIPRFSEHQITVTSAQALTSTATTVSTPITTTTTPLPTTTLSPTATHNPVPEFTILAAAAIIVVLYILLKKK